MKRFFILAVAWLALSAHLGGNAARGAALSVDFHVEHVRSGTPQSDRWRVYPLLSQFRTHTLRSSDGLSGANGTNSQTNYLQHDYATFAALMSAIDSGNAWTLVLKGATPAQDSTYSLTPDFSAFPENSLPQAQQLTPTAGAVLTTSTPTFVWQSPSTAVDSMQFEVDKSPPTQFWFASGLTPTSTSATFPNAFADGSYFTDLWLYRNSVSMPMLSSLISGPDLGPIGASFSYDFQGATPFTIAVPEPASATALISAGLSMMLTIRRRRNRETSGNPCLARTASPA